MNSLNPAPYQFRHLVGGLAALVVLGSNGAFGAPAPAPAPASAQTNSVALEMVKVPVSVFVWNFKEPNVGVDPFYPESARIKPAPVVPVPIKTGQPTNQNQSATNASQVAVAPVKEIPLTLTGVMGSRVAIINAQIFNQGESGLVTLPDGAKVRIKVEEIKSKSVQLTIFVDETHTEKKQIFLKEQ